MGSFIVEGGHKLSGTIRPQGAKNEALQVISAVLLTKDLGARTANLLHMFSMLLAVAFAVARYI